MAMHNDMDINSFMFTITTRAHTLVDVAGEEDDALRALVHPDAVVGGERDKAAVAQVLVQVALEQAHGRRSAVDALEDLPAQGLTVGVVLLMAGRHHDVHLRVHLGDEEGARDVPVEVVAQPEERETKMRHLAS